jgi:hypothetical protein
MFASAYVGDRDGARTRPFQRYGSTGKTTCGSLSIQDALN